MSLSSDDSLFFSRCRTAVDVMRRASINETQIALVLAEVRSAAISQEFSRVQELLRLAPPTHWHLDDARSMLEEYER